MNYLASITAFVFSFSLLASGYALAADDSKVKAATEQVERGAKKIPDGKIGEGVEETTKGIGGTVSEGANTAVKNSKTRARPPSRRRRPPGATRAMAPSTSGAAHGLLLEPLLELTLIGHWSNRQASGVLLA